MYKSLYLDDALVTVLGISESGKDDVEEGYGFNAWTDQRHIVQLALISSPLI